MAAGDVKFVYGTAADVACTVASLASSTTLLVGRESATVDNSANLVLDYLCSGKITTGTSPTTARSIQVWCVASWDGTTWPAGFAGSDAAGPTLIAENKNSALRLVAGISTVATSDVTYHWTNVSIASLFGGVVPVKFSFFVTHDTAVNLNSTGSNHQIRVQPVFQNVAAA